MSEQLSQATLEPHLNSTFTVEFEDGKLPLELVFISEERSTTPRTTCFSIEFSGPEETPLQQQTYHLTHESLESLSLFLTPVERKNGRYLYESVFHYLIED